MSQAAKLAIMMAPVSVCHQLSCTGSPSTSRPHTTASGLRGSPTDAMHRSALRSNERGRSVLPAAPKESMYTSVVTEPPGS
ncbi:hypothetical protein EES42_31450 [Streptomyces sp. ADI95-17]|nr:hypothetical protein EES42_31450 [Streptomyces sp. ADI95-17]